MRAFASNRNVTSLAIGFELQSAEIKILLSSPFIRELDIECMPLKVDTDLDAKPFQSNHTLTHISVKIPNSWLLDAVQSIPSITDVRFMIGMNQESLVKMPHLVSLSLNSYYFKAS